MSRKNRNKNGIVYSTNPNFNFEEEATDPDDFPAENEQKIKVQLQKKHRAGKTVTVVYGFEYPDEAINQLGKQLKQFCGTGGSVKDGEIILQGDFREKAAGWLKKKGFDKARSI